jgi:hypothetical protein
LGHLSSILIEPSNITLLDGLAKSSKLLEKETRDEGLKIHVLFKEMKFDMRASLFKINMEANYRQGIRNLMIKM